MRVPHLLMSAVYWMDSVPADVTCSFDGAPAETCTYVVIYVCKQILHSSTVNIANFFQVHYHSRSDFLTLNLVATPSPFTGI